MILYLVRRIGAAIAIATAAPASAMSPVDHGSMAALLRESGRPIVVAHRGCHNAAPGHQLGEAPENSRAALDHCVAIGADMMETDIHRTRDGYLVIIHDDSVDRTTNGHGDVADLTLAEIRTLRLRQNEGSYDEPLTDQRVMTLDELLAAAKGRITINLDVKGPIYSEVADAVLRAGMADGVTIKTVAGIGSPPLASIAPYDRLPFIAIVDDAGEPSQLPRLVRQQLRAGHPVAFELHRMAAADVPAIRAIAEAQGVALFANTLGDGYFEGWGGDNGAKADPDDCWGKPLRAGIRFIQTDYPEDLIAFSKRAGPGN